jgi:hypothetical protein
MAPRQGQGMLSVQHATRIDDQRGPDMKAGIALIALALIGCATTTKIVPAGQDTYMISAANDACGNCTPPEFRISEQASSYCASMSKTMVVKDTKDQTYDIGYGKRVTVTFSCVPKTP